MASKLKSKMGLKGKVKAGDMLGKMNEIKSGKAKMKKTKPQAKKMVKAKGKVAAKGKVNPFASKKAKVAAKGLV